jgi:hercynylcysteine S-oxide lyase
MLKYPMEDVEVVQKFIERVRDVHQSGRKVKIAMFDIVLAFPDVRMP